MYHWSDHESGWKKTFPGLSFLSPDISIYLMYFFGFQNWQSFFSKYVYSNFYFCFPFPYMFRYDKLWYDIIFKLTIDNGSWLKIQWPGSGKGRDLQKKPHKIVSIYEVILQYISIFLYLMFNGDFQKMKRFLCHNYINAKNDLAIIIIIITINKMFTWRSKVSCLRCGYYIFV